MSKIFDMCTLVENGHTDVAIAQSILLEAVKYFEHNDEGSRNYMRRQAGNILRLLYATDDFLSRSLTKLDDAVGIYDEADNG